MESLELRQYFLKILSTVIMPYENTVFSATKMMEMFLGKTNIELPKSYQTYLGFIDLLYQSYSDNSNKFVSDKISDSSSVEDWIPTMNYISRYQPIEDDLLNLKAENLTHDGLINYIENVIHCIKKIELFIFLSQGDLGRLKLWEIQQSLFNYGRNIDGISKIQEKIVSGKSDIITFQSLLERAKNILLQPSEGSLDKSSALLKKIYSYLFDFKSSVSETSSFERIFFEKLEGMRPQELSLEGPKATSQLESTFEIVFRNMHECVNSLDNLEASLDSYINNPIFSEAANQEILGLCKKTLLDIKNNCARKEEIMNEFSLKFFKKRLGSNRGDVSQPDLIDIDIQKLVKR